MASHGGLAYASDGRLQVTDNETPTIASSFYTGGWALRGSDGAAYVHDLVASAVPATAKFLGGFAFSQNGSMYVTTQVVAASDVDDGGARLRNDGALRIVAGSPQAGDPQTNSWFYKASTRQLYVQIL